MKKIISIFMLVSIVFANNALLSKNRLKILELKNKKNQTDSAKLEKSWVDPVIFSISKSKSAIDTDMQNDSTKFILSLSQDIFRSGGIYYAIKYAKANKKLNDTLLKLEKNSLLAKLYGIVLNIKKQQLIFKNLN